MIKNIEKNSPADLGGLKPGDKILVINNENVEEASYTTVVNRLKEALTNQIDLNLIVMNIIEYNMFKEKNPAIDNCNLIFLLLFNIRHNIIFNNVFIINFEVKFNEKEIEIKRSSNQVISDKKDDLINSILEYNNDEIITNEDKINKFEIENFVNSEFNPFHDVPNEMFSPFLHYTSLPPPPVNFQVNNKEFSLNDTDPFEINNSEKNTKKIVNNIEDSNSELSENSIVSLNNKNNSFKFSDFNMKQIDNDFDDNFIQNFQIKQDNNDNNNKIVTKAKPMMAVKASDLALWNSSTSDESSDNGNDLIENENISQISTPKIRDRF